MGCLAYKVSVTCGTGTDLMVIKQDEFTGTLVEDL